MQKKTKILFISAVYEEIEKLLLIKSSKKIKIADKEIISINPNVFAIYSGIGIINTSFYLALSIEKIKPDVIIQVGIGGGFENSKLQIGDIVFAKKEIFADFGIEKNDKIINPPFFVMSHKQIKRNYNTDKKIFNYFYNQLKNTNIKFGNFLTKSSITTSKTKASILRNQFNAIVENMEGVAAAHIAYLCNIPFLEIRTISNFVGETDRRLWNKKLAFKNINTVLMSLIQLK